MSRGGFRPESLLKLRLLRLLGLAFFGLGLFRVYKGLGFRILWWASLV